LGVLYAGLSIFGVFVRQAFPLRCNFRPTRNDEDVGLHCMFEIVRSCVNGRFSVTPGKDVTIENLGYNQTKPTSSKFCFTYRLLIKQFLCCLLWYMCNRAGYCILPCGFFLLSFFLLFSSPNSAVSDWMSAILQHVVWPQCEFRIQV